MPREDNWTRFYNGIAENVRRTGRHILCIPGNFSYTIGNHLKGYPELVMTMPLSMSQTMMVLNDLSSLQMERGRPFADEEVVSLGGEVSLKVIEVGSYAKREFTIQAGQFMKTEDYRVFQVLVPDTNGNFPDGKCDPPYDMQEIIRDPVRAKGGHLRVISPAGRA